MKNLKSKRTIILSPSDCHKKLLIEFWKTYGANGRAMMAQPKLTYDFGIISDVKMVVTMLNEKEAESVSKTLFKLRGSPK